MFKALVFAALMSLALSHTCLIYPEQRDGISGDALSTPGADDCGKTKEPCGGTYRGRPTANFTVGKQGAVTFQKNLDHYYSKDPGFFEIRIGDSDSSFYKTLGIIPDSPDIKTMTKSFTVPEEGKVIQLIYQTNNPEAPPYFYQCADITLVR